MSANVSKSPMKREESVSHTEAEMNQRINDLEEKIAKGK